jgi:hypothetical protein
MSGAGLPIPRNPGPSAVALGGHEATVLIMTFEMTFEAALQEAEAAAFRGETALLIRLTSQAMPDTAGFRRIQELGAFLMTIPFMGDGYVWPDQELRAEVEKAISCYAWPPGPFPRTADGAAMPTPQLELVPDLTAEQRREFLEAIYARHDRSCNLD